MHHRHVSRNFGITIRRRSTLINIVRTEIFIDALDNMYTYKHEDSEYKGGPRPTFLGKATGHLGIITEGIYRNLTSVNNSTHSITWCFYQ